MGHTHDYLNYIWILIMTYAKNSLVEASDYNSLRTSVNSLWGLGSGSVGLGQSNPLAAVASPNTVSSTEWKNLANRITTIGKHQDAVISDLPSYNKGDLIQYVQALTTNISSITASNGSAFGQGTTTETKTSTSSTWSNSLTFTHTVSFDSGDAARYFFNAGGQILLTPSLTSSSTSVGVQLFKTLATLSGTWVVTGIAAKIAQTNYTPFTKIGGSTLTDPSVYNTALGYYGLTTSYAQAVKIVAGPTYSANTGYGSYSAGSFIKLEIKTNGLQGGNNDNGSTLTFKTTMSEVPNGLPISGVTQVACYIKPPSTNYLTNTWGTVTVSGTVTGN
jgi:hypothetical protein